MEEYASLLKNIAKKNEQEDLYRLLDIFLGFSDDYIRGFKEKGVPDDDLKQECALVISEIILAEDFFEKNNRRDKLIAADCNVDEVFKDIIHDVSTGCEKALAALTDTENRSKKAGAEVLARVRIIDEGVKSFCNEYGIKPTPAELSEYLGIDEDIIIEAVELSGYEIKDIDFDTPIREGQI